MPRPTIFLRWVAPSLSRITLRDMAEGALEERERTRVREVESIGLGVGWEVGCKRGHTRELTNKGGGGVRVGL